MSDLNKVDMPWNTPHARAALINAPGPYADFTLLNFPRDIPLGIIPTGPEERSIVLYGEQGSGKTSLGICMLRACARAGVGSVFQWNVLTAAKDAPLEPGDRSDPSPVWFERWSRLLARNRREHWDEEGWFEQLEDVTVLMLDDVGAETGTQYRQALLLRHLEWAEDRHGRRLVLTLNDPPTEWAAVLGERVADRMQEQRRFLSIRVPGGSLR